MKWMLTIVSVLAFALTAEAHRLDEYLQATRLAVSRDKIQLSVNLTPGVAIFPDLLPLLHLDGQGRISGPAQQAYAQRIIVDLSLELDGKRQDIKLIRATFPARANMEAGEGTIQLTAVATIPELKAGRHEVVFRNDHLPKISVYLVNALVPEDEGLQITGQTRDELQSEYRMTIQVKASASL
jgi:hypothetical protein